LENKNMFSWKEIVFTFVLAIFAIGLGVWQGKKESQSPKPELQEVKQQLEEIVADPNTVGWIIIKMDVSAYCPCETCCEQWADIPVSSGKRKTASGHTIHVGDKFVAAPRNYPFGTEMVIEGYAGGKVVKVEDVGGAIKGNKLDLYFDTHNEALIWGRRDVFVRVKIPEK
jgi:3D (Asp-Asp-Asp) domain-containing protein